MIYEPAEDSYLLQKQVEKFTEKGMDVLDMGTGSGIQASTAKKQEANITAADINPECVAKVNKLGIKAIQSDLFENVGGKFDLIIFNPPYLPEDPLEPEDSKLITTGGKTGSETLNRFLKKAKAYLKKDGKILIVVSSLTKEIDKQNFKFKILAKEKIDFEILIVYELS